LIYDSHCHLDYEAFDGDRDEVLSRASGAGVGAILVPGVDRAQWKRASVLRSEDLELAFAVGIHPQVVDDGEDADAALAEMDTWIDRLRAVAIGELGWDTKVAAASIERQDAIADAQIEMAKARSLPIILHVLGAHGHALERLRRHSGLCGVVHSYSGPADLIKSYIALGLSISFGPSVTRPNARRPIEAAIATPIERLLVETDGPCQFPFDREDRRGEPADVVRVIEAIARARGERESEIAGRSSANARAIFAR
jgi:TatD DNase family protein